MFGLKRSSAPPPAVVQRLEELEDAVKRLERRFAKLQGEFSATVRQYEELLGMDDQDVEDLDDVAPLHRRSS